MTIAVNELSFGVKKTELPEIHNDEKTTIDSLSVEDGKLIVWGTANRVLKKGVRDDSVDAVIWVKKPFRIEGALKEAVGLLVQWAFTRPTPDSVLDFENEDGVLDLSSVLLPKTSTTGGGWNMELCKALAGILTKEFGREFSPELIYEYALEGNDNYSAKEYRAKFNRVGAPYYKYYAQAKAETAPSAKADGNDI